MTALNEKLFESAANAHTFASIMGPVIGKHRNLQFVLTAVLGGFLSVMGIEILPDLGCYGFLSAVYQELTQPFMQGHSSSNSIIMAGRRGLAYL